MSSSANAIVGMIFDDTFSRGSLAATSNTAASERFFLRNRISCCGLLDSIWLTERDFVVPLVVADMVYSQPRLLDGIFVPVTITSRADCRILRREVA